jgi:hypothetical protein
MAQIINSIIFVLKIELGQFKILCCLHALLDCVRKFCHKKSSFFDGIKTKWPEEA